MSVEYRWLGPKQESYQRLFGLKMNKQLSMRFRLDISAEKYKSYYQGQAKFVLVTAEDGRSLKFPVSELQRFVTHSGVQGRFEISFDENHKLQQIRRIS